MDPSLANLNLAPPPQPVLVRGLLPALLAHVLLVVALASGVQWKRTPDASKIVAVPELNEAVASASPAPVMNPAPAAATPAPAAAPVVTAAPAGPAPAAPAGGSERVAMGAAAAVAPAGTGPSFDCAKARSTSERIICADRELSQLDRDLGRLHARAKAAAPDPAGFKRENDAQWKLRESTCRDRDCLLAWYSQRRDQLLARLDEASAARAR